MSINYVTSLNNLIKKYNLKEISWIEDIDVIDLLEHPESAEKGTLYWLTSGGGAEAVAVLTGNSINIYNPQSPDRRLGVQLAKNAADILKNEGCRSIEEVKDSHFYGAIWESIETGDPMGCISICHNIRDHLLYEAVRLFLKS